MPTDEQASAEEAWERHLQSTIYLSSDAEKIAHAGFLAGWRHGYGHAARKALEDAAEAWPKTFDVGAPQDWLRARAAEMYPNDHEPKETD